MATPGTEETATDIADPVTPEPAATVSDPAPPMREIAPPPRQPSVLPMIAGGVAAAVIGFGAAQFLPRLAPGPADPTAAITAQKAEIERLSQALAALPAPTPPTDLEPLTSGLAALTDRVAATETAIAAIPAPVDPGPRIGEIEKRVARLEALPPGTVIEGAPGADPAAMAELTQEIATLKADLAAQAGNADAAIARVNAAAAAAQKALSDAQAEAATLRDRAAAAAAAAEARAALGRIAAAVETGQPYASAVEALRSAGTEVPEVLASPAAGGLPTLAALQAAFPEAARTALDDSLRAEAGAGTMDRLGAFLRSQTGARSLTPREGTDADAVLSRAEAALHKGDLAAALAELATLPEAGKPAMADWTAAAQARLGATTALAALTAAMEG